MRICILIPSYKEYENLKKLIPLLHDQIYKKDKQFNFATLVVDDNSPDGTKSLLKSFQKKYQNLFISFGPKKGLGSAMKRGYTYALKNIDFDAILTFEADFVVSPTKIIPILERLKNYDVVLASRNNENEFYRNDKKRLLMHRILNDFICQKLAGSKVTENTAACRAIKKEVLNKVPLNKLPDGYAFFPSMLFELQLLTPELYEYKTKFLVREKGVSKTRLSHLPSIVKEGRDYLVFAINFKMRKWKNHFTPTF